MDIELNNILEVKNITKVFEDGKTIFEDLSFDVREGEFLSILGSSGCGKTTLLRILIGLIEPTKGKIFLNGLDVTKLPASKRKMGMVFQNYALFDNMTVYKNIIYALRFNKELKYKSKEITDHLIEIMKLDEYRDFYPANLSGGQQQCVAIARTLALNPKIILFDEPMSALDADTRIMMRKELMDIKNEFNTTMIYITHDQEEAFDMSDRIMVMRSGFIEQIDTPRNLINNPKTDYIKTFVIENLQTKLNSIEKNFR